MRSVRASAAHERFYLLDGRDGGATRTLVHSVWVAGSADEGRLSSAIREVLGRHDELRSSLRLARDGLMRDVHDVAAVPFSSMASDDVQGATDDLRARRRSHVFIHGESPLTLVDMICGADASTITFTVHHAIFDAVSAAVLLESLVGAYDEPAAASVREVRDPAAPPLPSGSRPPDVAFWSGFLREAHEALPPQIDPARGARGRRRTHPFDIPPEVWGSMGEVRRTEGASRFVQVLAAAGDVLGLYVNQPVVCCSVVVDSRRPEAARSIGNRQNVLPVALRARPLFPDSVSGAFDALWDAMEHAGESFEAIAGSVRTEALQSPAALARVLVAERTHPGVIRDEGGRSWSLLPAEAPDRGDFELAITLVSDDHGPRIELDVLEGGSDPRDVDDLGTQLVLRLSGSPLGAAPVESPRAVGGARGGRDGHVLLRVLDSTRRHPDRVLIDDGVRRIRGDEIGASVDSIARSMVARGVVPGDRVVVRLPREADLVIAMLAVWRAGAVLVPVEHDTPHGRMRDIESDCDPVVVMDGDTVLPPADHDVVLPALQADAMAYILYTSGTTGRPKGVVVGHDNLSAFLDAMDERLGSVADSVVAATSVAFDISLLELIWPLTTARAVRVTSSRDILSGSVAGEGSLYQCTPTTARMLLASSGGRDFLRDISTLIVGGESLPATLATSLRERVPRVINAYGPTECTIWATFWEVPGGFSGDTTSIGSLLPQYEGFVLNHDGAPSPIGTPGSFVIAGPAVAHGYWRRPEETARCFREELGVRRYDTGDFVSRTRDGALLYRGRRDLQVKVLGRRVELAAVEQTLSAVPGAAGIAVAPSGPERGLACFVLMDGPDGGDPHLVERLERHADEYLQGNERPVDYSFVRTLPQTPSGKLDRRALARMAEDLVPDAPRTRASASREPNDSAGSVRSLWASVLGRPVVEDDVSFFDLGGSSVQLLRVLALLRVDFPGVTLADLFEKVTPRDLAATLRDRGVEGGGRSVEASRRAGARAMRFAASRERFGAGRKSHG